MRVDKLRARRVDPQVKLQKAVNEVYERIQDDDAVRYAIGAMQPIDPEYTANTYAESGRVQDQLAAGFLAAGRNAEYTHQGSVTSDTHIRAYSDIDLLVLETRFLYLEPPLVPSVPYTGNPIQDLSGLRAIAETKLTTAFHAATVDCTGAKAICMSGGSLRRKIDVVIASWLHTPDYANGHGNQYRGVYVLDRPKQTVIMNKPFLHNHKVDQRDHVEGGGFRKIVRLLKSLKYDAAKPVSLASYDVTAIAYGAPSGFWNAARGQELMLVQQAFTWLDYLNNNRTQASELYVPNGTRKVFTDGGATYQGLAELHREVAGLLNDINQGLSRSFRKLNEARIGY